MPNIIQNRRVLMANPPRGAASYTPPGDAITSKVLVAMSLRRLFLGNAEGIEVRESGGNTNADIGTIVAGQLDADAFNAHVGVNNGFARTAYDQKGTKNFRNTTAANQPQVTLAALNAHAALTWDSNDYLLDTAGVGTAIGTGDFELWIVAKPTSIAGYVGVMKLAGLIYFYTSRSGNGKAGVYCSAGDKDFGSNVAVNTVHLLRLYRVSGTLFCDVDGTACPNSWGSTDNLVASGVQYTWSTGFIGVMPEMILINGALTSDERDALKTNIATFYGIPIA